MSPGSKVAPILSMKSWRNKKRKHILDPKGSGEQAKASKSDERRPDKGSSGTGVPSNHQSARHERSSATLDPLGAAYQRDQSDASRTPDDQPRTKQQPRDSDISSDDSTHNPSGASSVILAATKEPAKSPLVDTKVGGKLVAPVARPTVTRPPRPFITGQSDGLSSAHTVRKCATADLSGPDMSRLAVKPATTPNSTAWLFEFSDVVAKWDGLECAKFANGHKELINNAHLISDLRRHATKNIVVGNLRLAENHISAIAVATICREDPKAAAQQFFISMGVNKRYHDICASERTRLERRLEGNKQTDHVTASGSAEDHLLDASKISELISSVVVQDLIQDKFHLQPPRVFAVGGMFALIQYHLPSNTLFTALPDGNPKCMQVGVYSTIAYFVSVKMADDYCLALEAKSDVGRNVSDKSHRMRSHEVLHDSSNFPRGPQNTSARDKAAIRVQGVHGRLGPKMRLDFGRVHTVEHNKIPALEVGRVTDDSRGLLLRYWQEEMLAMKA